MTCFRIYIITKLLSVSCNWSRGSTTLSYWQRTHRLL